MGSPEIEEVRCVVSGRVQGVMYRDFVRRHARRRKLVGFVRNLENGTVEVLAQGPKHELDAFAEELRKGPLFSKVTDVTMEWRTPHELFTTFDIIY